MHPQLSNVQAYSVSTEPTLSVKMRSQNDRKEKIQKINKAKREDAYLITNTEGSPLPPQDWKVENFCFKWKAWKFL